MRRWRSTAWSVAAAAITLSSAAVPISGYQSGGFQSDGIQSGGFQEDASSTSAPFRVYTLNRVMPSAAKKMFVDLYGELPREARILADDERGELIVTGSESVQALAQQLVTQLNTGNEPRATAAPSKIVRTYSVAAEQLTSLQQQLVRQLSSDARIAADSNNQRIVIAGTEADHDLAMKVLSSPQSAQAESLNRNAESLNRNTASALLTERDNSQHAVRFRFRNITAAQASSAIRKLLTPRVVEHTNRELSFSAGKARTVSMTFDDVSRTCLLEGSRDLVIQFEVLLRQFDDARDRAVTDQIRFVSMKRVDPGVLNKAILLWQQSRRASDINSWPDNQSDEKPVNLFPPETGMPETVTPETGPGTGQGSLRRDSRIQRASFQESQTPATLFQDKETTDPADDLRRPSSDVTVEPLPDLDVLILRGRDPDVEELTRIIQEIERLSSETAPQIEIVYLQNVQGEALDELIDEVLEDLTDPLQGRVSITALIKPNALLLIGWGEAVEAAKKLIARLDESVHPQTQMQVFALKNAAATQVENTVSEFLNNRGGLAPDVRITADPRTNSVMVNAAPRDMQEVARIIQKLDAPASASVNQARIYQLKNALAADVAQTITSAMQAARGGTGGQRSAALEMLMVGPDGRSVVASGLLDDVKLTPDSRTNRIFITGPPNSIPLVEELIKSLDETPAASAQIKVFQITNGDASDLVQVLRSLFPEQVGASNVPALPTAEEETSLVPVRFSVDIRTNSIIATGTAGDLRIIEVLLLRLDETGSQERVNKVYRLKNSPALDVANAVSNFLRSERVVNQAAPGRQNPFAQIESEVVVVPEPVGNALIISATPRYYDQILELIEDLDAQPPQVMIQVILAEVELENLHEFGIELGIQDSLLFDRSLLGSVLTPGYDFNNKPLGNANTPESLATKGNTAGQAISHFSLGRTNSDTGFGGLVLSASSENISVLLRALNQSRNMEILSRPQVMTLDNQPAFIQVGERVPRIVGTSINQVGQVNNIELENVGLILGVTPRISPDGMVVMEIDAEKSELGLEANGIPVSVSTDGSVIRSPRVNITTAQTTVSAASGQTIVIGGLITSNNTTVTRSVPWLGDVPVLGHLFRFDGSSNRRKELLIILTPHVIRGQEEGEYIKQVEMARMSWISCDMFDWMNTNPVISGQMDDAGVQTIYPDQSPGVPVEAGEELPQLQMQMNSEEERAEPMIQRTSYETEVSSEKSRRTRSGRTARSSP